MTVPWPGPPDGLSPFVLIVEDHDLAADAWRLLFEATGYRVGIAPTAAAAVRACADQPVDLMLLDLTLPDGSGLTVLAKTASAGTTPRITVALTGHDDRELTDRCYEAGCTAVLVKPVLPRDLLTRAAEWIR
jgi:two-component system, OmpR family, response regulator